ncbi:sialic acid-binding Ig-like lectin 13 [Nothobranchius furzeri]|uniref:Sialic acid-binding Ig-like lectin 13 n=2 Tax=Nothobranchius furzeri TaxID=105023 RepID=A0A9D3BNI7_NOTFU|nr:sialic acid-binding Ig-like lectin 13 [Nothobranchius furzeri]
MILTELHLICVKMSCLMSAAVATLVLSVFFLPGVWARCGSVTAAIRTATPQEMEALSGSCLLVPCSLRDAPASQSKPSGFWINGDYNIFDSSNAEKLVNVTGNLTEQNCTTVFYNLTTSISGDYFFRLEEEQIRATACDSPLRMTVKDSAWSPRINISGGLKDLKEKESVSITCSALTPCPHSPPKLTWTLRRDSHTQTEGNADGTMTTKIQENITLSDTHDGYSFTCSVSYPVNGGTDLRKADANATLKVFYAPKDTSASISPSGAVSLGSWVTLSCSSRAKPPVSGFSWFRISSEGPVSVSEGQVHRFNVTEGGEFYCVAANDLGNQTSSTVKISVGSSFLTWLPAVAGIIVLVVICLVVCACCFKFKRQTKRQTQGDIYEDVSAPTTANKAEELHYERVMFKRRPKASQSSVSEQDREQQETVVYAQVAVSKPESHSAQAADRAEDLYAQVKKK